MHGPDTRIYDKMDPQFRNGALLLKKVLILKINIRKYLDSQTN